MVRPADSGVDRHSSFLLALRLCVVAEFGVGHGQQREGGRDVFVPPAVSLLKDGQRPLKQRPCRRVIPLIELRKSEIVEILAGNVMIRAKATFGNAKRSRLQRVRAAEIAQVRQRAGEIPQRHGECGMFRPKRSLSEFDGGLGGMSWIR